MPTPTKITREQVLQRAIEIVDDAGAEGLSMRELAGSLGVKAMSLYRYFPDKMSLELAVADYEIRKLLECLKVAAGLASPGEELIAVGEVYLAFARARPNLYRLMMEGRAGLAPSESSSWGAGALGKELWGFLVRVTGGGAEMGRAEGNAEIGDGLGSGDTWRAVALWSFLHGFASLEGAGRFGAGGPGASGADARGLGDAFAVGLKALRSGFLGG